MNRLPLEKRCQIIQLLVEGCSLRSCSRIADVSINTVTKLLIDVGRACSKFHDQQVTGVDCQRLQCDEIWAFVYCKKKNVTDKSEEADGDAWTFIGMDADTKLVISWYVGARTLESTETFLDDLCPRLSSRWVQLTTDGFSSYPQAVIARFDEVDLDYAQLVKRYGIKPNKDGTPNKRHRYIGADRITVLGNPKREFVSTSYLERQNLTVRMSNRRFTRKTNAFSKKIENHCLSQAIHFVYYNFARIHKSLRVTPAMQAGLTKRPMTFKEIVNLAPMEAPRKRGLYKRGNV